MEAIVTGLTLDMLCFPVCSLSNNDQKEKALLVHLLG